MAIRVNATHKLLAHLSLNCWLYLFACKTFPESLNRISQYECLPMRTVKTLVCVLAFYAFCILCFD